MKLIKPKTGKFSLNGMKSPQNMGLKQFEICVFNTFHDTKIRQYLVIAFISKLEKPQTSYGGFQTS